jgi:hypothetical protein
VFAFEIAAAAAAAAASSSFLSDCRRVDSLNELILELPSEVGLEDEEVDSLVIEVEGRVVPLFPSPWDILVIPRWALKPSARAGGRWRDDGEGSELERLLALLLRGSLLACADDAALLPLNNNPTPC